MPLLPARLAGEQSLQGTEAAEIAGVEPEHAAPGLDRGIDATEDLAFELAQLSVQLDHLVLGDSADHLTDFDDALNGVGQLLPRLGGLVQVSQGAKDLEVVRGQLVGSQPGLEGVAVAFESFRPDPTESLQEEDLLLGRLGDLDLTLDDLDDLLPHLAPPVQFGQGGQGLRIFAADVEHPSP